MDIKIAGETEPFALFDKEPSLSLKIIQVSLTPLHRGTAHTNYDVIQVNNQSQFVI